MKKIYVVGGSVGYANWTGLDSVFDVSKSDVVMFTGGADVSPELYGARAHPTTMASPQRDRYEEQVFRLASGLGKPMVGICRGAQFLCVMAGGKLIQNQQNMMPIHKIETSVGDEFLVTSDHHQAQYPWNLNKEAYNILGWASPNTSNWHHGESNHEMVNGVVPDSREVEVCYYPKIKALGIQSHPEWQYPPKTPFQEKSIAYFRFLLGKLIDGRL